MTFDSKVDKRREKIIEILMKEGSVKVKKLSELFGTTSVTIRSDLAALEKEEYLQRTSGGAIITPKKSYKVELAHRIKNNLNLKQIIAKKTAEIIPNGSTLMINSGTTTILVAKELRKKSNLNIVTNSIEVAMELGTNSTCKVILLGGSINAHYGFLYGNDTIEQMLHYKADYAILAMDGICINTGLTTFHAEEALVNRIMIERSRKVFVTADSTKFEHEGFYYVSDFPDSFCWITDDKLPPDSFEKIRTQGIEVICASPTNGKWS
jgi:DeoR/GlpR family transcriptional regulator of sugar metabolism